VTATGGPRLAVLGLGEAGALIAADLALAGVDVHAYDPADVTTPPGVERHAGPAEAAAGADVVLAVTAAAHAVAALDAVAGALRPGTIYADLSTSAPALKRELAAKATEAGAGFVDVALMAPVPGRGLHVPALASGPAAGAFAAALGTLGMPVEVVGDEAGQAAARKLLRSVVMKGLAQLLIESLDGAEAAGFVAETWDDLVVQLTSIDEALVRRLGTGSRQHALRRLHEMEAAVLLLDDLGVDATMTRATVSRLRQSTAADDQDR
jgi:3-hydroxyisobutyrate dehydrogenase-like beta-hydroxyacid dehydrogenase